jgi:hypothetical protein
MDHEETRWIRRCARCGKASMRCTGVDLSRGDRRTLLAARYRCGDCSHAIRVEPTGWGNAITGGLLAALFIGGSARLFIHDMVQVSGGPEGHGWYEWLMNGSILLVGLLLGGGLLFASRKSFASVAASVRNPVVGASP